MYRNSKKQKSLVKDEFQPDESELEHQPQQPQEPVYDFDTRLKQYSILVFVKEGQGWSKSGFRPLTGYYLTLDQPNFIRDPFKFTDIVSDDVLIADELQGLAGSGYTTDTFKFDGSELSILLFRELVFDGDDDAQEQEQAQQEPESVQQQPEIVKQEC